MEQLSRTRKLFPAGQPSPGQTLHSNQPEVTSYKYGLPGPLALLQICLEVPTPDAPVLSNYFFSKPTQSPTTIMFPFSFPFFVDRQTFYLGYCSACGAGFAHFQGMSEPLAFNSSFCRNICVKLIGGWSGPVCLLFSGMLLRAVPAIAPRLLQRVMMGWQMFETEAVRVRVLTCWGGNHVIRTSQCRWRIFAIVGSTVVDSEEMIKDVLIYST